MSKLILMIICAVICIKHGNSECTELVKAMSNLLAIAEENSTKPELILKSTFIKTEYSHPIKIVECRYKLADMPNTNDAEVHLEFTNGNSLLQPKSVFNGSVSGEIISDYIIFEELKNLTSKDGVYCNVNIFYGNNTSKNFTSFKYEPPMKIPLFKFPPVNSNILHLNKPEIIFHQNELECRFQSSKSLIFTWTSGTNSVILSEVIHDHHYSSDNISHFISYDWIKTLNMTLSIYCIVGNENPIYQDDYQPIIASDPYNLMIKVTTEGPIDMYANQHDKYIELKANAPPKVTCANINYVVKVEAFVEENLDYACNATQNVFPGAVFFWEASNVESVQCGFILTNDSLMDFRIPIRAQIGGLQSTTRIRQLKVYQRHYIGNNIIWENLLKTVQLNINNSVPLPKCYIGSFFSLKTFDNKFTYYHGDGSFVLYKHKILPYEVQGLFSKFATNPIAKIFAVMIFYEKNIIMLRKKQNFPALKFFSNMDDVQSRGIKVFRSENHASYTVLFSNGLQVVVTITHSQYIDAEISTVFDDFNNTEGLCGIYNNDESDDLTARNGTVINSNHGTEDYLQSWRVNLQEYLINNSCQASVPTYPTYCLCQETQQGKVQSCGENYHVTICEPGEITENELNENRGYVGVSCPGNK